MVPTGMMPNGRSAVLFGHSGSLEGLQDWLAGALAFTYLGGFVAAIEFALAKLVF